MTMVTMGYGDDEKEDEEDGLLETQSSRGAWSKGVTDPDADDRLNIWSLNGFGQPVLTGGNYQRDEAVILEKTVKNYCSSKNITLSELCGGEDHIIHNKSVRGAWQEIAQCLPHRTVLSVYRRAFRQLHGLTRGAWSKEEISSLFHLVDTHGHRWKVIQDKLGRTAVDCRVKFFDMNDQFKRGKWSVDDVELLLREVRAAVNGPRNDMDVREINTWTLEKRSKIPWTSISCKVNRRRLDCYFKWKQMTKRSNKKAKALDLEPVPMARDSLKVDARAEYLHWKAEQDPKWRKKYADEYILPLLQKEGDIAYAEREQNIQLVDSIIESRANRSSEVSWHTMKGDASRERWEALIDKYASENDLDLPLWKLAKVVRDSVVHGESEVSVEPDKTGDSTPLDSQGTTSDTHISGISIQQLQTSIKEITDECDKDMTVKGVRRLLEEKYGADISFHKRRIKALIKGVVNDH